MNDTPIVAAPAASAAVQSGQLLIEGRWQPAQGEATLPLYNPSDGSLLTYIARGGAADTDRAVAAARRALPGWARLGAAERGRLLTRIGALVLEETEELARLEALDVGKPLRQA